MEWISVEDKMPGDSGYYLVTDGEDIEVMQYHGMYKGSGDWSVMRPSHNSIDVTHWKPFPHLAVLKLTFKQ